MAIFKKVVVTVRTVACFSFKSFNINPFYERRRLVVVRIANCDLFYFDIRLFVQSSIFAERHALNREYLFNHMRKCPLQ